MEDGGELSSVMVLTGMNGAEYETLLLWFPYYFSIGEVVLASPSIFYLSTCTSSDWSMPLSSYLEKEIQGSQM